MATKKDLVIVALSTFCLTATLFLIIPTRSQDDRYDPWLDANEDGTINILDISASAQAFWSSGDPTKNVTVTNLHDYDVQSGTINFTGTTHWDNPSVFCGGYSRLSVLFFQSDSSIGNNVTIYLGCIEWSSAYGSISDEYLDSSICNLTAYPDSCTASRSYITETKAPYCHLVFRTTPGIPADSWIVIDYAMYLRNE